MFSPSVRLAILLCAAILSSGFIPAFAGPPVIKARVEEPVLEELMGGCSLRCSIAWHVEASIDGTAKGAKIKALTDEKATQAWVAPAGPTPRLRIALPAKLIPELEESPVYGIDLINGHWATEELWKHHARVKRLRIWYNDKPFRDVTISDSRRWQRITFPDIYIRSGDRLMVEILETYPGTGAPLAISELVLQGAH